MYENITQNSRDKFEFMMAKFKEKEHSSAPCRSHWRYHTPHKSESRLASGIKMHLLKS